MPEVTPMYRIRQVNGHEEEIVDTLTELHHLTFFGGANVPEFDKGHWWLAFRGAVPIAFAGLVASTRTGESGGVRPTTSSVRYTPSSFVSVKKRRSYLPEGSMMA